MPQARRASLLGRRAEVHLENNRSLRRSGGQRGGAVDVRSPAVCRPNRVKPGSVPARRAAQRRAKHPARPEAIAAAADGVRLPSPF
jgi:hypothetical protein